MGRMVTARGFNELVAASEINAVLLERGLALARKPDFLTLSLHELAETWKPTKAR